MMPRGKRGPFHTDWPVAVKGKGMPVAAFATRDPRIQRAIELLKPHHPATVNEVATELNLSVSRFRHLFKQELKVSPTHYLKLARLEHARNLIASSFLRIKEVAALVGSNDVSHFVRDYKAQYGHTPSESRALVTSGRRRRP
jgi:transcriptional regulator GlxA family with amidase domain